jgi:hypothetical protein
LRVRDAFPPWRLDKESIHAQEAWTETLGPVCLGNRLGIEAKLVGEVVIICPDFPSLRHEDASFIGALNSQVHPTVIISPQ